MDADLSTQASEPDHVEKGPLSATLHDRLHIVPWEGGQGQGSQAVRGPAHRPEPALLQLTSGWASRPLEGWGGLCPTLAEPRRPAGQDGLSL